MKSKRFNSTARITGNLLKYGAIFIMLWDANDYLTSFFFFGGVTHSALERNLIFNGQTPHLYKDFDMSNPENFRRAESVYFLEKFE